MKQQVIFYSQLSTIIAGIGATFFWTFAAMAGVQGDVFRIVMALHS